MYTGKTLKVFLIFSKKKKKILPFSEQGEIFSFPLSLFIWVNRGPEPTSTILELGANTRGIASQTHYYSVKGEKTGLRVIEFTIVMGRPKLC